ncbi:MAG: c-type cytochrome [Bryobacteraceae bacterium]|jgi:cytochrome c oxidase cbb3-type subunit 3
MIARLTLLMGVAAFGYAQTGQSDFVQQCGFCHGRDAGGGEDGPDLTRSKLVAEDKDGDKIGPVVRNGRPQTSMPAFTVSDAQLTALVTYIHARKAIADSLNGQRRGVDVADLQTGDAQAGKQYFNGAGNCKSCHSPTGDLAGVATRLEGLKLFQRLMYPRDARATMAVTLPNGEKITGDRAYQDEFTVALRDAAGSYRSWPASKVKVTVDDPAQAHADLLAKYTDEDIHNLMAYLQTLKQPSGAK